MVKKAIFSFVLIFFAYTYLCGRSPFRKKDPHIPEITIGWKNSPRTLKRSNWIYTENPLFTIFNELFFHSHLLPTTTISSRTYQNQFFACNILDAMINRLVKEIQKHKSLFTDFIVLQDKNFNYKRKCGLLVLKFKKYPFVLKLFMETPKTFVDPYCKGFENQFFFYMSGGMNRHLAGLMRIKNLELIQELITTHERWRNIIITPRKWYWLPKKPKWIEIKGRNIGDRKEVKTTIPGTYAIIADELDTQENLNTLTLHEKSKLIMQLCMDLRLFVDPHADNFIIKYKPGTNDYTISIVDTEHFPSMVGLKEEPFFNNHIEWYLYLGAKYFQDAFLQTKYDRQQAQNFYNPYTLTW